MSPGVFLDLRQIAISLVKGPFSWLRTRAKISISQAGTSNSEASAKELSLGPLVETGPPIVRSEKRLIRGLDCGSWRDSLVEEIRRNGPKRGDNLDVSCT